MTASAPRTRRRAAPTDAMGLSEHQQLAGILLVVALMCLPTLRFGFVYDDQWVLVANGYLRSPEDVWLLFTPLARERGVPDAFRPSSVLLDLVSYSLLGLRAWAHHLLSIALHLSCCSALYLLVRRLGAEAAHALGSCLLFGLLGIHAEAVAVVSFREDLLAASAGLFACVLAIAPRDQSDEQRRDGQPADAERDDVDAARAANTGGPRSRRSAAARRIALACAALLAAIACSAKESAWPLPFALAWVLALDPFRPTRAAARHRTLRSVLVSCAPLVIGLGLALIHRLYTIGGLAPWGTPAALHAATPQELAALVQTSSPSFPTSEWGPIDSLSRGVTALVWSLGQALVPIGLSPEYPERGNALRLTMLILAAIVLIWSMLRRLLGRQQATSASPTSHDVRDGVAVTIIATATMMVPLSGLIELPNAQADRQAYFWTVPLCVALAALLLHIGARLASKRTADLVEQVAPKTLLRAAYSDVSSASTTESARWLLLLVFAGWQGASFVGATHSYASDAAIWARASKVAPDQPRVQAMLGLQDLAAARPRLRDEPELGARVRLRCEAGRDRDPRHELPHICLAQLALALEDFDTAERESRLALALARARPDRLLGDWLEAKSRRPAALEGADRSELLAEIAAGAARFPYSSDLAASSARVAHRLGEPQLALERVRSARSLRPERWQTVALGLEIALDTGDAPNVAHTFWVDRHFLDAADPATRSMLARRFQHLMRSHPTPLIDAFFAPGVFPDESP